ncbi:MAG: ERCC4 domain-containing protein [Candidatus Eisenbacteria bacterium]
MPRIEEDRIPIVVDSREQRPYRFDERFVVVTRHALAAGDYSVVGHENEVAVERKSLGDFVSSVIRERERFERELARLADYQTACVLVEADARDVVDGRYRSHAHPNSVLGSAIALYVDYGIPFFFCSTREIAGRIAAGILRRFHRRAVVAGADAEVKSDER